MSVLVLGTLIVLVTVAVLAAGVPVAFALGGVGIVFLLLLGEAGSFDAVAASFFGSMEQFTLVAIPMFVLMGGAAAASRVGGDIGEALKRWLHPAPGGLIVANLGAAAVFAGLAGSSPATCAGIGRKGLPEMLANGYPRDIATGAVAAAGTLAILIPPSLTLIVFAVSTDVEMDIGRLFLAGLTPGLMLVVLFIAASLVILRLRRAQFHDGLRRYDKAERLGVLPRALPILAVVVGVVYVLVNGSVEPSEAAGVGALLIVVLIALVYDVRQPRRLWEILQAATRESVMILMIVAGGTLFGAMLSEFSIPGALAQWVADQGMGRWTLIVWVNLVLLLLGCFLPPVAVILMTVPVLLPMVMDAGFDPVWFAVMMTVTMQIGLITPPAGLNLKVVHAFVPEVSYREVLRGAWPFLLCMAVGIVLLCAFPEIAIGLPDALMGPRE